MIKLDENYWNNFSQKMGNNQKSNKLTELGESIADKTDIAKGLALQASKGYTWGTAPVIAGGARAIANLYKNVPNSIWKAKNLSEAKNNLADIPKKFVNDFRQANEEFKQQSRDFEEEHPYASFAAELGGGIGSGAGVATGLKDLIQANRILKSSKALNSSIGRAAAEGGLYGVLSGASNTEGKTFDPLGATIGAGAGALGGAALGTLGKLAKKVFLSKNKGTVGEMIRQPGINESTMEYIETDPKVAEAVANGDIGKQVRKYSKKVQENLANLKKTVADLENEAYSGIDGKTLIDLENPKTVEQIENAINKVEKNIGSDTQSRKVLNGANAVLKDIKNFAKGTKQVSLENLKNLKDRIYRLKNSAYKTEPTGDKKRLVSPEAIDLLDNIYSSLVNAEKVHSPQLKFANEFYSDMKKVAKELADIKIYDENTAAKNAAKLGRDEMGDVFEFAENKVKEIFNKYERTKGLGDELFTSLKQKQVAKNIKPDSHYGVLKTPLQMAKNILTGGNREQKMQSFAQAVKEGKITKEMLDKEIQKGRIAVAPFINYYLGLAQVPQANMASNVISQLLPKNTKSVLERKGLPIAAIRTLLNKYYNNKEQ